MFISKIKQEEFEDMMSFVNDEHLGLHHDEEQSFRPNKITNLIAKWNNAKPSTWATKLLLRAMVKSVKLHFDLDLSLLHLETAKL